jgi:predicted MFS family arabinose efflux permease
MDRFSLKGLYLTVLATQIPFLALAAHAENWWLYLLQGLFMISIFGAIPFTDAMIVRYVDDRMRSRVAGMRLAVSFGASSLAVWLLGPLVKQAGFSVLLWLMAAIATMTFTIVTLLPNARPASVES